jgi:aryl-alcohol dehydrogenase-like predicted oxidoreductase
LHSPPTAVIESGEWEAELEALKRAGKIRHYGISCDTVEAGLAALRFPGVASLQFRLTLLEQDAIRTLLPHLRAGSVAGIARECLANGLLVKSANEIDLGAYFRSVDERRAGEAQLAMYRERAVQQHCSMARLALDFVASAAGVAVSLLGARSSEQLRALLGRAAA